MNPPPYPQTSRANPEGAPPQKHESPWTRAAKWVLGAVALLTASIFAYTVIVLVVVMAFFAIWGYTSTSFDRERAAWLEAQENAYPYEGASPDGLTWLIENAFVRVDSSENWPDQIPAPSPECADAPKTCKSKIGGRFQILENSSRFVVSSDELGGIRYYYSNTREGARVQFELFVAERGFVAERSPTISASDIQCDILFNESGPGDLSCTQLTPWRGVSSEYWREARRGPSSSSSRSLQP